MNTKTTRAHSRDQFDPFWRNETTYALIYLSIACDDLSLEKLVQAPYIQSNNELSGVEKTTIAAGDGIARPWFNSWDGR